MDFTNLIERYGRDITIKEVNEGSYSGGRWVEGTSGTKIIFGVLLNLNQKDLEVSNAGDFNREDKKLLVKSDVSINLDTNEDAECYVLENGITYKITDKQDYSNFGKVKKYIAKRVVVDD